MDKEKEIQKQIDRIKKAEQSDSYSGINNHQIAKRTQWMKDNMKLLADMSGSDVRKAYEMILIKYIGIDPEEVPVVSESDTKIIWRSYNWCPVLEACKRINVDTRKACKEGWEESVDKMAKIINPKLYFFRNYNNLRPHGEYCEESFELIE